MNPIAVLTLTAATVTFSSLNAQTPIRFGDVLLGTVSCSSTTSFSFNGQAGDKVLIHCVETDDFGGVCGGACFCFDQHISARDSSNNVIAVGASPTSNNNKGRYRTPVGPFGISNSSTHTIEIRDKTNNGRGSFSIFVQSTNNPQRATAILSGAKLLVPLTTFGAVQTFTFSAKRGEQILVSMTNASGAVVPQLALYDPQGDPIALPTTGTIAVVSASTGTFTLLAFSAVAELGAYNLQLLVKPFNQQIKYPGTGEDLVLQMGVNAQYGQFPDVQSAIPNDILTLHLDSPGGSLRVGPHAIVGQLFKTGAPPTSPLIGLHLDLSKSPGPFFMFNGLLGPLGTPYIPLGGISVGSIVPVGLKGFSVMIQGVSLSANSKRGYATTHGHEVRFL